MFQPEKRRKGRGVDRMARKFQILTWMMEHKGEMRAAVERYGREFSAEMAEQTVYQIGKAIGLTPSQHLRGLLHEMVNEQVLIMVNRPHRKNVTKECFRVASRVRWNRRYMVLFRTWEGKDDHETLNA